MSAPHQAVATYLREIRDGRSIGVAETSFYPPLAALLNAAGAGLKPKVRCIIHPKSVGAGLPDGGLYTSNQIAKDADAASIAAQLPERGVVEVKGTAADVDKLAGDAQVRKYLARYGQVLITNYRDFLLVGRSGVDTPVKLERYSLAPNEVAFWQVAATPEKLATEHGTGLIDYLQRVMLSKAPLADPKDVAWFLASYARDARARVERAGTLPALAALRTALEDALGISFQAERGEHFFRSTLVQTLFYGIFSAWVLWSKEHPDPADRFDWRSAAWYLRVPMIASLFEQVASPTKLQPLGLVEVLNWTGTALNRVERATFFERFEEDQAVQYFYEPFLEAFDPELRKELGVWYTPREIVRYQVERVDRALREELGIPDGLADERVYVLDPCCGTGAYLVEVLKKIEATLRAQGSDDLLGEDVKKAACSRVFGFELLPAPFVVAHLQLGLALQDLGAPLTSSGERVGVYLTNALTGWEPPDPEKEKVVQLHLANIPALQEERDLARQVKREATILVILGNPPYSGYAGIARIDEERDLSNAYRTTKLAPEPEGQGLNDLRINHEVQARFDDPGQRFILGGSKRANLTDKAADYLESFGGIADVPLLFHHTVAILHAPAYAVENAGALRQDWPRVPLPVGRIAIEASAALGQQVAALLDPEQSVAGVTSGAARPEVQKLGGFTRVNSGVQQPGELELTAGWGYGGRGGITMPGQGRLIRRDYTADERTALAQGAASLGLDDAAALALLGEQTCDVYLNDLAYWRNVPVKVWDYTIGGYQVLKKWLSYRERDLLGRALKVEEVREVTAIVRRIAALLLLGPQLDANYRAVAADTYEWFASR